MILDDMFNMNGNRTKYSFAPLNEADDFGDGSKPSDDDQDDNYEIQDNGDDDQGTDDTQDNNQDNGTEHPTVENPDDNNDQTDDQNTGDDSDDNYEVQDDDDSDQDTADNDDDQSTGDDDQDDGDDYEIQDDNDDSDDDGTDDSSDDNSSDVSGSDADTSGGDNDDTDNENDPRAKLNALEKSIFDQLSPDQQKAKTAELKKLYQMAFDNCQKIIDTIANTDANPNTVKVFDYIVSRLTDLKGYITDYLKDVFDTKGYLENMTEFQKYLAVFDTIKNTFDDIQKEQM